MTFRIGSLVLAALALSGSINAATRVTPIHSEREKMSETRRRDLVLDDLKSILTGPSSPTTVTTEPYASSVEGLCQRDVVQLKYANKKDGTHNSRVHPIGIGAVLVQYYYVGRETERSWAKRQEICEQLSGQKIYWAFSDDEHYAFSALATLRSTVADVRDNQRFKIDCGELDTRETRTSCAEFFLFVADQVSAISRRLGRKDGDFEFISSPYRFSIIRTYSPMANGGYSTAITMRYQEIVVT